MNTNLATAFALDPLHLALLGIVILALTLVAFLWRSHARSSQSLNMVREELAGLRAKIEAAERAEAALPALRAEIGQLGIDLAASRAQAEERATALAHAKAIAMGLEADLNASRLEVSSLTAALAADRATADERLKAVSDKEAALTDMRKQVEETFQALAASALARNQQSFLEVANELAGKEREASKAGIAAVLAPVQEALGQFREKIEAVQKDRAEDRASLVEQVKHIGEALHQTRAETGRLVTALRASPKTRGRWGEEQLRNILELSGLSAVADFTEQTTVEGPDGQQRPDVVIRLPGERCIVVDSKVALDAYLDRRPR